MFHPHDKPYNGSGGTPGTHEGHADPVPPNPPTSQGDGMGSADDQGPGNRASQARAREQLDGASGAAPPASGNYVAPVNQ